MVRRALLLLACCASAVAQEPGAVNSAPAGDELKNLHELLEQQGKQLDVLAQEVARLNLLLENRNGSEMPAASGAPAAPAVSASHAPAEPTHSTPEAAAPKAVLAAPAGLTHEVTKGETLTSIAKHYKVTVGELLKVNKITDVRRLQIGQTLALPPDAKPQPSPNPSPEQK